LNSADKILAQTDACSGIMDASMNNNEAQKISFNPHKGDHINSLFGRSSCDGELPFEDFNFENNHQNMLFE